MSQANVSGEIVRVWHGWTAPEDADAYERCLVDGEAGLVETLNVEGYLGDELLRRDDGDEVEFVTLLRFEEYDAVAEFAGEDYERAHVPDATRELLSRWEDEATHYRHRASAKK